MKFWDTSAIVPLCVNEPESSAVKSILAKDSSIVVWWATRTECISAFMRQTSEGGLTVASERQARQVLTTLATSWIEVQPTEPLRVATERLLAVHTLRSADAFQLAAALEWRRRQTAETPLVAFDTRLREAAYKEGFSLLPPELP
ncbi:MAG: type II toxin-antitoxin system VapC family toxin [Candidatus Binatia bacterium]